MRTVPSILHVDMDAFFAAVEVRDKPSLAGKPVIVGGVGPRGVVSTATYEARVFGVHSAMPMAEARRRCPWAAVLAGRFGAYRMASDVVMDHLRRLSPAVEPVSLDEAFVDLAAGDADDPGPDEVTDAVRRLRADIRASTGLAASVGAGTSKLVAKIASDLAKPDGLLVVGPAEERALLEPLAVGRIWGVGPVTAARLARLGLRTIGELARFDEVELVRLLGEAHGRQLARLARGQDDRPVQPERVRKSVGAEETFDVDIVDRRRLHAELDRLADRVARRLDGRAGRTVSIKVRRHDFSTLTRAASLAAGTDDPAVIRRTAGRLLDALDTSDGVRLLGVAVAGFADHVQPELPALGEQPAPVPAPDPAEAAVVAERPGRPAYVPGLDVVHDVHGRGWVQGLGLGRITVRFETAATGRGPARTLSLEDPHLHPADPLPWPPG